MSPCLRKHQQMNYNLFTTKFIHPWRYFPFCFQARQLSSVSGRRFKSIRSCFLRFTIEILFVCNSFGMDLLGFVCVCVCVLSLLTGFNYIVNTLFPSFFLFRSLRAFLTFFFLCVWVLHNYPCLKRFRWIIFEFISSPKYWKTIIIVFMIRSWIRGRGGCKR